MEIPNTILIFYRSPSKLEEMSRVNERSRRNKAHGENRNITIPIDQSTRRKQNFNI